MLNQADYVALEKITKDVREASKIMSDQESKYLCDLYYGLQDFRIQLNNKIFAITKTELPDDVTSENEDGTIEFDLDKMDTAIENVIEPHETIKFFFGQFKTLESNIATALDVYSNASPVGRWARLQTGVGPVLAANFLALIDITKARTAGAIWRYAGLVPGQIWLGREGAEALFKELWGTTKDLDEITRLASIRTGIRYETLVAVATTARNKKGEGKQRPMTKENLISAIALRPWNAQLKKCVWKLGDSFNKQKNRPTAFYGQLLKQRKAFYVAKNLSGAYAEDAKRELAAKKYGPSPTRTAYEEGRYPDGRIESMSRRWVVKMFLSHYHEVAYRYHYGVKSPVPYVMVYSEGKHTEYIPPPFYPWND